MIVLAFIVGYVLAGAVSAGIVFGLMPDPATSRNVDAARQGVAHYERRPRRCPLCNARLLIPRVARRVRRPLGYAGIESVLGYELRLDCKGPRCGYGESYPVESRA